MKYFYKVLKVVLASSLKGSGKLLPKAQNGVRAAIYASRRLETMFRVYTVSVRPSDRVQHVKQPQKSASHYIANEGHINGTENDASGSYETWNMVLVRDTVCVLSRKRVATVGKHTEPLHGGYNPDSRRVILPRLNTLISRV